MCRRIERTVTLAILLALLAGCGGDAGEGGGAATETAPTPGGRTPEATATETALGAPTPTPEPPQAQATVVDVINDVEADPRAEGDWLDAEPEMAIYVGGHVRAQEASTARVAVEEGLVRVAPNTLFTFEPVEGDTLQLNLQEGQMWINVDGDALEGKTFEVETPAASASVRGTRFGARVGADGATIFSTQVGTVTVSADGAAVEVGAGYQTTVAQGDAPGASVSMPPDEQVRWGMAAADDLDVVMPVSGVAGVFTQTGNVSYPRLSPNGDYVVYTYYVNEPTPVYAPVFYDVQAAQFYTPALPLDADSIRFSPTGDRLAYTTWNQICVANVDGSDTSCFGGRSDFYSGPTWSPNGEWLLFYSSLNTSSGFNLFKARPDGGEMTQLTFTSQGYNEGQSWSPDGSRIAYVYFRDYDEPAEAWVLGADGSAPQLVFTATAPFDTPPWNPTGSLLAACGYKDKGTGEGGGLWLIPLDGSGPRMVPGTDGWSCYDPVWSPTDSGWPLFFRTYEVENGQGKVYWYAPDGEEGPAYFVGATKGPLWSDDGTRVAFVYGRGEEPDTWTEIYVFDTVVEFTTPYTGTIPSP